MKSGFIIVLATVLFTQSAIAVTSPVKALVFPQATITGFEYTLKSDRIYFHWTVTDNQAADKFELQSSTDGTSFSSVALVFGTDISESNQYKFFVKKSQHTQVFRIRIIQKDGSEQFHPVVLSVK
ncbi:MAG: hypothetical protein EOO09_05530 [Chitinophagaceae bacterium]|nr:MAG: hypothetical protein EOO09_05530 [Chitinophagaceae bacterium]